MSDSSTPPTIRKSFGKFVIEPVLVSDGEKSGKHSEQEEEEEEKEQPSPPPFILHSNSISKESPFQNRRSYRDVEDPMSETEEKEDGQFILVKKGSSPPPVRRSFGALVAQGILKSDEDSDEELPPPPPFEHSPKQTPPLSPRKSFDDFVVEANENHSANESSPSARRSFGNIIVEAVKELPPPPIENEKSPQSARSFGDVIVESSFSEKYHSVKESSAEEEVEEPPAFKHLPTPPQSPSVIEQLPKTTPIVKPPLSSSPPVTFQLKQHSPKPSLTEIPLETPTNTRKPVEKPPKSVKEFFTLVKDEAETKKPPGNSKKSCSSLCLACVTVSFNAFCCCKLFNRQK